MYFTTLVGELGLTAELSVTAADGPAARRAALQPEGPDVGSGHLALPWCAPNGERLAPGTSGALLLGAAGVTPGDAPGTWTVSLLGTLRVFQTVSGKASSAAEARAAALDARHTSGPWQDLFGTAVPGSPADCRLLLGDGACHRAGADARPA